jgi:exonuclease VII small subunit
MNNLKLFIIALYAVKPDLQFTEVIEQEGKPITFRLPTRAGEMNLSSPIGLAPYAELAASELEAKQMGLERALEMWPRSDGWKGHAAIVWKIEKKKISEVVEQMSDEVPASGEDDNWPELVM